MERINQRIPELDGLRGLAISIVVYFHFVVLSGLHFPGMLDQFNSSIGRFGWAGVDLFFVMSGFLIGGILLDAREAPNYFKTFYIRRACRILPIYLAVLLAYGLFYVVSSPATVVHFLGKPMPWYIYATFTQNAWMVIHQKFACYLTVSWSLAAEEQFYITLPLVIRFAPRRLLGLITVGLLVITMASRVWVFTNGYVGAKQMMHVPFWRTDALLVGFCCALLVRNEKLRGIFSKSSVSLYKPLGMLFLWMAVLVMWPQLDLLTRAIFFTLVASACACVLLLGVLHPDSIVSKLLRFKPLMAVGGIAYGLYLIHESVHQITYQLLSDHYRAPQPWQRWLVAIVGVLVSGLLAAASWRYFEAPILRIGKRFSYGQQEKPEREAELPELVAACNITAT